MISPFHAAQLLSCVPSHVSSLARAMPDVLSLHECLPGLGVDTDIIHFMAEKMEIAIQDSGSAYQIHSAGNPSKRGQEHNRFICCMLSYAGVCM